MVVVILVASYILFRAIDLVGSYVYYEFIKLYLLQLYVKITYVQVIFIRMFYIS